MKNTRIHDLLAGKGENYVLPFFWQHGEDEETLREGMRTQEYDPNAEPEPADMGGETDGMIGGDESGGIDNAYDAGQMDAEAGDAEPVTGDGETDIATGEADPGDAPVDEAEGAVG